MHEDWVHLWPSVPPLGDQEGSVHSALPGGSKAEEAKKGLESSSSLETRPDEPNKLFQSWTRGYQEKQYILFKIFFFF